MNDERSLLGKKPEFNNPQKYLKSGEMTDYTGKNIQEIAKNISGENTEEIVKNIVIYMNKKVTMNRLDNDEKKFKRTAKEIVEDGYRNGCSDSSTLFTAIARAKGIPTMQIVSFEKEKVEHGHFFAGVFSEEDNSWYWVDPDKDRAKIESEVEYKKLNLKDRNLPRGRYAYAYVNDFREIELNGMKIDSIENIGKIQRNVYKLCDKRFINFEKLNKKDVEYDER